MKRFVLLKVSWEVLILRFCVGEFVGSSLLSVTQTIPSKAHTAWQMSLRYQSGRYFSYDSVTYPRFDHFAYIRNMLVALNSVRLSMPKSLSMSTVDHVAGVLWCLTDEVQYYPVTEQIHQWLRSRWIFEVVDNKWKSIWRWVRLRSSRVWQLPLHAAAYSEMWLWINAAKRGVCDNSPANVYVFPTLSPLPHERTGLAMLINELLALYHVWLMSPIKPCPAKTAASYLPLTGLPLCITRFRLTYIYRVSASKLDSNQISELFESIRLCFDILSSIFILSPRLRRRSSEYLEPRNQ